MSDTKKKIYLGEDLVCQTFTDAEEQAKAFDLFGLEQPVVSSNAPASARPVQQGQVCEFDGVDDYIEIGSALNAVLDVNSLYVGATFNYDNVAADGFIVGNGEGGGSSRATLSIKNYISRLSVVVGDNGSQFTSWDTGLALTSGQWHTAKAWLDGTILYATLDGTTVSTSLTYNPAIRPTSSWSIGRFGTYSAGLYFGGKISFIEIGDANGGQAQYNLNHASGTTAYDSSGNGNHGTLQNGAAFVVDNTLPPEADKLNLEGYTDDSGVLKPRDESDPANDIDGNPLQYSGSVYPRRPEYRNSYAASFDGVDDYISAAHLTGSETVTSSVGASTPSISAGRIDFTAGTCSNLILSDGTQYPLTEGAGDTAHDISGNGNHGTINNASTATEGAGFWAGRIDGEANALNNNNGFSKRMLFDGVDDYVNLGNSADFDFTNNIDITLHALIDDNTNSHEFVGKGTGTTTNWNIDYNSGIRFFGYESTVLKGITASAPTLTNNTKAKIRCTFNGTTWKIYVDDVEVRSVTDACTLTTNSNNVLVGERGSVSLSGTMYDISINGVATYTGNGNTDADWTDQIGSNDGTVNGSPALLRIPADTSDPTKDVYGDTLTNPAITDGYNGAETELDAYNIAEGDNPSPATNNNPDLESIEFGADFASNDAAYMRLKSSTENDRLITFEDDLTGGDETLAQKYTQ